MSYVLACSVVPANSYNNLLCCLESIFKEKKEKKKDLGSPQMSCIKKSSVLTLDFWSKEVMLLLEDLSVLGGV